MLNSRTFVMAVVLLSAAGCKQPHLDTKSSGFSDSLFKPRGDKKEPGAVVKAQASFGRGDYGNAEKHYRQAVEENPKNAEAWLGLAATYDRLKRFDNANKAYDIVIKLAGFTPTVLNNLGYHYMLRGKYKTARKTLEAAQKKDPDNKFIQNNLDKLEVREKEKKEDSA